MRVELPQITASSRRMLKNIFFGKYSSKVHLTDRLRGQVQVSQLTHFFRRREVRFSSNLRRCVGTYLFSRAVASQVSSARQSLTSVFGMGTGGPSALITPTILTMSYHRNLLNYISGMLIKNQTRECTQQLRSFDRLRSFNRFKNHL